LFIFNRFRSYAGKQKTLLTARQAGLNKANFDTSPAYAKSIQITFELLPDSSLG